MHTHISLWKNGETIMYDPDGYGLLSDTARHYVGGLLAHAPALLAFCAPTTNSYKRLAPPRPASDLTWSSHPRRR